MHNSEFILHDYKNPKGIFIGPEGGWSDSEKQLFKNANLYHLNLHDFTLRAETACVVGVQEINRWPG